MPPFLKPRVRPNISSLFVDDSEFPPLLPVMSELNDEGGGPSSPQPASPPRLINISVGDDSLTTPLTKSLHRGDPKADLPDTPETVSSQFSDNNNVDNFTSGLSDAKSNSVDSNINNNPSINPSDPSKMALDNYSQHSNPYADSVASSNYGSNPYADSAASTIGASSGKTMEVTVTVLSLHGMMAKKNSAKDKKKKKEEKKRMKKMRRGGAQSAEIDKLTATIVASFSQNVSKDRVFLTHVPSLPVSLTPDAPARRLQGKGVPDPSAEFSGVFDAGPDANGGKGGGEMLKPVVHWSSMDAEDEEAGKVLSTLRFKRKFVRESNLPGGANRYLPQTCPINLSVSRNGRMALLGTVNLIINGEERGKGSVTVPVASSIRPSKSKMGKKIRKMGKSKDASGEKDGATPMVRIKGDTYQFGLEGGAMLRMLVHVHDPDVIPEEDSFCAEEAYGEAEHRDGTYGDEACGDGGATYGDDARGAYGEDGGGAYGEDDSISDNKRSYDSSISDNEDDECVLSVEGDNPSILGGDDYFSHLHSGNELHTLRQQLAKSEQTNNVLQMELANAQHSANQMSQLATQRKVEYDALVLKLQLAVQNTNDLLQEVKAVKAECELVPIYENRVTELLEELRKRDGEVKELTEGMERRDLEIECLKEEIDTLNGRYKKELADSLLWDDKDDGDANLGRRSDGDGCIDVQADEKKVRDNPLDKWGIRKLARLNVVPEEKGGDVDEDGQEEEADDKETEAETETETETEAEAEAEAEADAKEAEAEGEGVDGKQAEEPQDKVPEKPPSEASPDPSLEVSADGAAVDSFENDKCGEEGGSAGDAWPWEEAKDDKAAPLGGESPKDSEGERAQDVPVAALEAAATAGKDKEENDESSKKEASGGKGWGVQLFVGGSSTTADEKSTEDNAWTVNDAAKKEEEEEESPKAASSSNDDKAGAASMRQGRGWGIRGLGASLLSMEERMRERQQLFQEQQLKEAAEKKAREEAAAVAAAPPGLGGVLISRFSSHGAKRGTAGEEALTEESAEASAEESAEGTDDELAEIEKPSHGDDASSSGEEEEKEYSEEAIPSGKPGDSIGNEEEPKDAMEAGEEVGEVAAKDEDCESERGDDDKHTCCSDGTGKMLPDTARDDDESTTGPEVNGDTTPKEDAAGDDDPGSTEVPDIPPPNDAEEANQGAKVESPAPSEGAGGEAPIKSLILGVASFDGDGTAAAAGGDVKNTSGGASAEAGGEGAPSTAQGEKKGDNPTDESASDAIVSSAGGEAEAEVLSTTNHEGTEADRVPDMPSANNDNISQSKKDPKGSEEGLQNMSSEAKEANADASPEKQEEAATEVPVMGDATPLLRQWGEKEEDPAVMAEPPPSNEAPDDSPKKQQRGWGVRGLGARLKGMEGKMKERQRLFREQQQRELERAEKEKAQTSATAAAQPGLGGALISRFSSHGGKKAATFASDGGGEEPTNAGGEGVIETQAEGPAASLSGDVGEDDGPDDTLTEEAREHRRRSNQSLLLESMDRLEEELLSGIVACDDETAKDEAGSSVLIDSIDKSTATPRDTNSNDEDTSSAIPSELTPLSIEGTFEDCENDRRAKQETPSLEAEKGQGKNHKEITEEKVAAGVSSSSCAEGGPGTNVTLSKANSESKEEEVVRAKSESKGNGDGSVSSDEWYECQEVDGGPQKMATDAADITQQEMNDENEIYIGLIEELPTAEG